MNFIPKPRQRNDIAPFSFTSLVRSLFCWMILAKPMMCSVFKSFFLSTSRNFTVKEGMCSVRNAFALRFTLYLTAKERVCSVFSAFALYLTAKKVVCSVRNAFVHWIVFTKERVCSVLQLFADIAPGDFTTKSRMCAIRNAFALGFTEFLTCFFRMFTAFTAFSQIVTLGR